LGKNLDKNKTQLKASMENNKFINDQTYLDKQNDVLCLDKENDVLCLDKENDVLCLDKENQSL
jgi:hypothetical protein